VERLLRVCAADDRGRPPIQSDGSDLKWLAEQAELLRVMESAPKPIAQGRDLIALGLEPSPRFGEILKRCFEAQLDGAFSDRAGALAYLKDLV
jgi:tRNA nucleotidyltransferase (CCA-adding enzyme)